MSHLLLIKARPYWICMVTHDARYADMAKRTLHLLDGKMAQALDLREVV
jgi:putative ABC transport system ATP-binding protein